MRVPCLVMSSIALLAALPGCVEEEACTLVACTFERAVVLDVLAANGANNQAALSGNLTFVGADGGVRNVPLDCDSPLVECVSSSLVLVQDPAPAESTELRFELAGSDGTSVAGTADLTWNSTFPNGPECSPECREALLSVKLE